MLEGSDTEPAIGFDREGDNLPRSTVVRIAALLLGLGFPVDCASGASSCVEATRVPRNSVVNRNINEGPRHPRSAYLEV